MHKQYTEMKKIYIILTVVILGIALQSCAGFLDQKPTDSTLSIEAITTPADAQVALNGAFRAMSNFSYYGRQFLLYADFKGGDMTPPSLGLGNDALFTFIHNFNMSNFGEYWSSMYYVILQSNNLLAALEEDVVKIESENDQQAIDNIKGQALFVRALAHFDLVRIYGYPYLKDNGASPGVAVVTEVLNAKEQLARNSVAEVYAQVIQDLTQAAALLNKSKIELGANYYAAKSLLARVYLYKGDWDNAYSNATEVINSGVYQLYTPENWLDSWGADYGSESIFELPVRVGENDLALSSPTHMLRPSYVNNGSSSMVASKIFEQLLNEDPEDVRWRIMGNETINDGHAWLVKGRLGWIRKYEKNDQTANNLKIIRLSEVYLIAAEAALKKSAADKDAAANYLNSIRKRSPSLPLAEAGDVQLEDLILKERRKEFICEGHTYFDYMRLGRTVHYDQTLFPIGPEGRKLSIDWHYYKCVMPIPMYELLANPNVVQNQGYDVPL
jgi:hypothetical protein